MGDVWGEAREQVRKKDRYKAREFADCRGDSDLVLSFALLCLLCGHLEHLHVNKIEGKRS